MLGQKNVFGSFCILIILPLALFLLALAAHFYDFHLAMPLHSVLMLGVLLLFALFFAPQSEYLQAAKLAKNQHLFEQHLAAWLKDHELKIGAQKKAQGEFGEFFDEFLDALKPLHFAQLAAAIFPMLGILGTFISIAISMPDFSSRSPAALEREISQLLGGIATAFYISIYGIFLAIWWMFAARLGQRKISFLKQNFYSLYKAKFWLPSELAAAEQAEKERFNEQALAVFSALLDSEFFENLSALHKEKFQLFSTFFKRFEALNLAQTALCERALEINEATLAKTSAQWDENAALLQEFNATFEANCKQLSKNFAQLLSAQKAAEAASSAELEQLRNHLQSASLSAKDSFEKIASE